jgi:hypothetical protein
MDQHAGRVDDRRNPRRAQRVETRTDAATMASARGIAFCDRKRLQMPAHRVDDDGSRQAGVSERLQDLVD